jgi:hypothetical protein
MVTSRRTFIRAKFVPCLPTRCTSALFAAGVGRGSTTISFGELGRSGRSGILHSSYGAGQEPSHVTLIGGSPEIRRFADLPVFYIRRATGRREGDTLKNLLWMKGPQQRHKFLQDVHSFVEHLPNPTLDLLYTWYSEYQEQAECRVRLDVDRLAGS